MDEESALDADKQETAAAAGNGNGPFRAMRHRNYRLFFAGQLISLVGTWVQVTALMWLAFSLTGTSRWPALIAAAQMAPACLLGAWGGVLADRRPRRQLVLQTQLALMLLAFTLAALVASGAATVWHLLILALGIGTINAIDLPARLALLVELVGKKDLVNAVGLNSMMFNLARAAGPALGIMLLPHCGPAVCFLLNGFSYMAVLAALFCMHLATPTPAARHDDDWQALREGIRYVLGHPILRVVLPLTIVVAMFGWPILALLPAIAERLLYAGNSGYSSLLSALGVGALLAAFAIAACGSVRRRWFFLGLGVILAATGLFGLSFVPSLLLGMLCTAAVGAGLVCFFATSQAVFQLSAADTNRGRVMSIYSIVLMGATPLGNLVTGPAADRWGEPLVLRAQALLVVAAAVTTGVFRWVRRARPHRESIILQGNFGDTQELPHSTPSQTRRAA